MFHVGFIYLYIYIFIEKFNFDCEAIVLSIRTIQFDSIRLEIFFKFPHLNACNKVFIFKYHMMNDE
jgi:hypothetical protein